MVDCSHGNSQKDYRKQPEVAAELCSQIAEGCRSIAAVMIESNLVEGNQKLGDDPTSLVYGQSVTDACISWQSTESVLKAFSEAVKARRNQ
jgi:3-deoxy-7-phosphoheptulonate synthase